MDVAALVLFLGGGQHRPTEADKVEARRLAKSESVYFQAIDTVTLRASHRAARRKARRTRPVAPGQGVLFSSGEMPS